MRLGIEAGFLVFAASALIAAQPVRTGPQVVTFFSVIDDTDQPYALYVPKSFDSSKRYPLVISLPGAFSNHRLNLKRVFGKGNRYGETDAEATRYFPDFPDVGMIVASPLARGTMGYVGIPEADVYAVMDDVKKRFLIDEDRIYLTGLSMGGGGALYLALTRPDVWAAVAAVCPALPPGVERLAGNALNIPIKMFQGDMDPLVPTEAVRSWRDRFQQAGVPIEYIEYPGVKHNSWERAYANAAIFDWFAKYKRNRMPEEVQFTTTSFKYPSAYWVEFDSFSPGTAASLKAKITRPNEVKITTSNLDGFTLKLDTRTPWTVTIDDQKQKTKKLSFRKGSDWREGRATAPVKRFAGVREVLGTRHVYIYGPGNKEAAERLANWSTSVSPLLLTLRLIAHDDVKPADIAEANLVLLGTRETNSFIKDAPVRLRPDAADYTLVTTAPARDRQIVIISGKPPISIAPRPFQADFVHDYTLMRGSDILARGNYDKNWKLSEEQRKQLLSFGVVEVAN